MPAVQSIRVIRRKIRAVNNIKKITRAMQMVSAAKLKKVQERLMAIRPYSDKIDEFLKELVQQVQDLNIPMFVPREKVRAIGVVVMMAEKGLCGSFNSNMARIANHFLMEKNAPSRCVAIGKKSVEFFKKQGIKTVADYAGIPTNVPFAEIREMTHSVVDLYERGEVDEVHVLYTKYVNAITFKPSLYKFLPIEAAKGKEGESAHEYIFEPKPAQILERLVPRYIETTFHRLLLESMSSEHAARMNAMKNATDNAEELVESLTLTYNKARQSGITKELLDIVGGAEALK